ncbi:MAG TPA: HAMP domain-containing protein, partial [Solirubrobacteraceae bacterium]|nr:HAMP domain-containing protein [Solirubrobacteraceae bacterium]
MSFRRRMVLLASVAVAAAVVIASVVVYVVTRNELSAQLDASLRAKITPGRQFVKIETRHLSQNQLVRLTREGKLPAVALAAVPPGFGVLAKAGNAVRVPPAGIDESAPAPVAGAGLVHEGSAHGSGGGAQREGVFSMQEGSTQRRTSATHRDGAGLAAREEDFMFAHRVVHAPKGYGPIATSGQVRLVLQGPAVEGAAGYAQLSLADGEVLGSTSGGSPPPSGGSQSTGEYSQPKGGHPQQAGAGPQPTTRSSRPPGRNSLLPITAATRAVASGRRRAFFSDVNVHGTAVRVLTARAAQGAAWQVALPLADLHSTLDHLRLVLALVVLGGIALAAALGLLVSRAALVPVRRLTGAAERVARTQDLGHRIAPGGQDELGRLSAS